MASILHFNDLACLNESASGSLGSGLASFARAEFPTVRGFVITPLVFSDFLKKDEVAAALDLYKSGAEDPNESWRSVKSVFRRARLLWNHEMDILTAFRELDATVSIVTTSKFGTNAAPVYASSGEDMLDGIKHCWLKWLKGNIQKLEETEMPSVIIREMLDSETSVELRKKGKEIIARAVFGLPEGLGDHSISSDIYEFKPDGELERIEQREQEFQYILMGHGPSRVEVDPDFRGEEKAGGDMLAQLNEIMSFMRENAGIGTCSVCFISARPVICSALLMSDGEPSKELPQRERSLVLLGPEKAAARPEPAHGPIVATKIFLHIQNELELNSAGDSYIEGAVITGDPLAKDDWLDSVSSIATEAKRRFRTSQIIIELEDAEKNKLERLPGALDAVSGHDMETGILIPGIRSADELAKVIRTLNAAVEGAIAKPHIWVRIMYPSNLFFMDSLARESDVLALDLDTLGRLMLGGKEDGRWLNFSIPALERALKEAFERSENTGGIAIMSHDLVSTPSLLEFLVRNGADILCVKPGDIQTVRHIAASVERRMMLEQGRVP